MADHTPHASATSTGAGTFQSALRIGGGIGGETTLIADEPLSAGGLDTGPTPYDLLAAALATCTTMTLRFYAQRQGWDIGQVSTEVTHHRVAGQVPADSFERIIHLAAGLDETVRAKLLGVAERCPVHQTLTAGAKVVTRAAGEGGAA